MLVLPCALELKPVRLMAHAIYANGFPAVSRFNQEGAAL